MPCTETHHKSLGAVPRSRATSTRLPRTMERCQLRYSSSGSRATTDRTSEIQHRRAHANRRVHGAADWCRRWMDQLDTQDHRGGREADLAWVLHVARWRRHRCHDVHLDPREPQSPWTHQAEPRHHARHWPSRLRRAAFACSSHSGDLARRAGSPSSRACLARSFQRTTRASARVGTAGSRCAEYAPSHQGMAGRHLPAIRRSALAPDLMT